MIQMKKLLVLSSLLILAACKQESKPVPDQPLETPGDSIKKDTVALAADVNTKLLAINDQRSGAATHFSVIALGQQPEYASFGKKITADKALSNDKMWLKYQLLKAGDTANVKFASKISSVCKKKGCWMTMALPAGNEAFVKFKDYEFFVPLNADNSNAIVSGKAFVEEVSVAELKHYAKDEGKSQGEIDKIKSPKVTYAFIAEGVLLEK